MAERQLHLFIPPKPLVERLGAAFFRTVPRSPGVYVMTGQQERVLYVGQSKNLRARLGSYKNARPDRAPRKVIRLIHAVERITWEPCESPEGARLRENELLRLYRPKFNRVNTWPAAYCYIRLQRDGTALKLGLTRTAEAGGQLYGAFKARAVAGYTSLLRLVWATMHQPASPHEFPTRLLGVRPPPAYKLAWTPSEPGTGPDPLLPALQEYLAGTSDYLVQLLTDSLPAADRISPFQNALQANDLRVLTEFYHAGPRKLWELSRKHRRASPLIPQEELDDLLV